MRQNLLAVCCFVLLFSSTARAEENSVSPSNSEVQKLIKELQAQGDRLEVQEKKIGDTERALADQKKALDQEKLQFERLKTQVVAVTGKPIQTGSGVKQSATASAMPSEVGTERKEAAREKAPEVAALIEEGGVLTGKGKIVVTPSIEYDHSSATSVEISGLSVVPAVNIGSFEISKVNRDLISPSIDFRYGLTNRLEIEAKIPYVWRRDSTLERPLATPTSADTLTTVNGNDIGDVEFAAHYQINHGQDGWPYFIGNLRFKTATGTSPYDVPVVAGQEQKLPTGSGFYAVQPSVTAIYPSDPLVYYANLGYLHNFSRSFANYGTISGGDGPSASLGMSLALNDKSSMSLGYSHSTIFRTEQNGAPLPATSILEVGTLDLGYSYNLTNDTNLNFLVSAGVTSDAPDVRLIFRVPMTFDLF